MKINGVIVTGVGGGVGQSIIKCLQGSPYRVIGVDSLQDAVGLYSAERGYLGEYANSERFIERLLEICKKENANVIFPGLDVELIVLARHKKLLADNGVNVVVSSENVARLADDKYLTTQFLKENGLFYPRTELEYKSDLNFPAVVKPRYGGARSKDCYKCDNDDALLRAIKDNDNYVIQEYIDGDEYTCGTINLDGKCYGCIPAKRTLRHGDTYKAYFEKNETIIKYVIKVMELLKPFGPCNVQLRVSRGRCYVFEFNARCSGTTAARAKAGFNEPMWLCRAIENSVVSELNFREIAVFRYWNELVVEKDQLEQIRKLGFVNGVVRHEL